MKIKLSLLATLAVVAVAACSPVSVTKDSKPATQKGAFFSTKDQVEIERPNAFKGNKKVIIPVFRVAFDADTGKRSNSGGGLVNQTSSVKANSKIIGVKAGTYQRVTDAAYKSFVADLKAAGYDVVDSASAKSSEGYKSLEKVENGTLIDANGGKLSYFAPTGQELSVLPGEQGVLSGFKAIGNNPASNFNTIMKDTGASVAVVTLYVDYLNTGGRGGFWSSRATVEIGAGISARAGSGVQFYSFKDKDCVGYCLDNFGSVKLGQAIYSTENIGELKDTTSNADAYGQAALNVVTSYMGAGTSTSRDFELTVDGDKYERVNKEVVEKTTKALVSKISESK